MNLADRLLILLRSAAEPMTTRKILDAIAADIPADTTDVVTIMPRWSVWHALLMLEQEGRVARTKRSNRGTSWAATGQTTLFDGIIPPKAAPPVVSLPD